MNELARYRRIHLFEEPAFGVDRTPDAAVPWGEVSTKIGFMSSILAGTGGQK
jgi:hypothetical protein